MSETTETTETAETSNYNAERAALRRAAVERTASGLKGRLAANRAKGGHRAPVWTEAEHAALIPFGERIKAKETSYYRACMDLQFLLPGRSFQGIRAKLKYWVEYGVFGKNVC